MSNELIMPEQVSGFATVLPTYSVTSVDLNNGASQRILNWKNHLSRFILSGVYRTVDYGEQLIDQYTITELLYFWHALNGPFKPFKMKVFSDYHCPVNYGYLEEGFGTGKPVYQLKKKYSDINIKAINKPKVDTLKILRNGIIVPISDVTSGGIQIDDTTGKIIFKSDKELTITNITNGVNPTITTSINHGILDGMTIYLTNLNNNSTLNNKAFIASYFSDTKLKLNGVTNNFTVTSGKLEMYAQPSEPLRWSGDFYYWVRFTDEFLDHTNAEGIVQLGTINLQEVRI